MVFNLPLIISLVFKLEYRLVYTILFLNPLLKLNCVWEEKVFASPSANKE